MFVKEFMLIAKKTEAALFMCELEWTNKGEKIKLGDMEVGFQTALN